MNSATKNQDNSLATLLHLSVFSKFIIPFGNFIFPVAIWAVKRKDTYIDIHGRNAINFQISLFIYFMFLISVGIAGYIYLGWNLNGSFMISEDGFRADEFSQTIPILIWTGILILLAMVLFVLEIFAVVSACLKSSNGEFYRYPLSINFLGTKEMKQKASAEAESKSD